MNLIKLLRAPEPASADLRNELDSLDIPGKARAVAEIRATRRQALLDGEVDDALDVVERELVAAQREHDRAVALDEELRGRLQHAEEREKLDALAARKAAAERESAAVAALMTQRFPALCAELTAIRDRNTAAFAECQAVDAALILIGSTDRCVTTQPVLDQKSKYNETVISRMDR